MAKSPIDPNGGSITDHLTEANKPPILPPPHIDAERIPSRLEYIAELSGDLWRTYKNVVTCDDPELQQLIAKLIKLGDVIRRTSYRLDAMVAKLKK